MAAGLYDITSEVLGKGHFAVVKLARHCLTSEMVAVKIIDKTKLNKEGLQQQSQEVRLLSRLSEYEHPNIVKLYQVIDTKTKLYLVMEYCGRDVCDLYDYIQKKLGGSGLQEFEAKHIFRQICSAIAYCHSLRIVHRDLKPENLLILSSPTSPHDQSSSSSPPPLPLWPKYPVVKLIDFGFANQWDEGVKLRTSCGSLAYSAPEILLGDSYDGDKVDIWGLGCILYILLYGNNPFMQINDSETLIRILDCTFSTPSRPGISDVAIKLIRSLLKKDPTTRLTISQVMNHEWFSDLIQELQESTLTSELNQNFNPNPLNLITNANPIIISSGDGSASPFNTFSSNVNRPESRGSVNNNNSPSRVITSSSSDAVLITSASVPSSQVSRSKSPNSANEVHDRVINQMVAQKMCPSKERVERALKLSRITSGTSNTSSPGYPRSNLNAPLLSTVGESDDTPSAASNHPNPPQNGSSSCSTTDQQNVNCPSPLKSTSESASADNTNRQNDSYISATYNLLKDKMLREIQGIPNTSQNLPELKSHTHKRVGGILPSRPRKSIISQAPRFNRPGIISSSSVSKASGGAPSSSVQPLDDISLQKHNKMHEEDLSESDVIPDAPVGSDGGGFTLPLQRKCSIVSEEGSCDLSGRLSEAGSDVHTFLLGDDKEPIVIRKLQLPSVDIVITDCSDYDRITDDFEDEDQVRQDLEKEVPIELNPVDAADMNSSDVNGNDESLIHKNKDNNSDVCDTSSQAVPHGVDYSLNFNQPVSPSQITIQTSTTTCIKTMTTTSDKLHFVSSSPDFMREYPDDETSPDGDVVDHQSPQHHPASNKSDGHNANDNNDDADADDQTSKNKNKIEAQKSSSTKKSSSSAKSGKKRNYTVTMIIDKDCNKGQVVDDVADHVIRHQGRRGSKPTTGQSSVDSTTGDRTCGSLMTTGNNSGLSPETQKGTTGPTSLRVITQSKSCNNITYNNGDDDESDVKNNEKHKNLSTHHKVSNNLNRIFSKKKNSSNKNYGDSRNGSVKKGSSPDIKSPDADNHQDDAAEGKMNLEKSDGSKSGSGHRIDCCNIC